MNATEIRGLEKPFRGLYALDGLDKTVAVGADPTAEAGMFQSVWQIIGSVGMNMAMTPIDAGLVHVGLALAGGAIFDKDLGSEVDKTLKTG